MSIFKSLIGVVMVIAFLAGCAATPITETQERIQIAQETSKTACYNQRTDHDVAIMEAMGKIPADQIAFVMMMMTTQEQNKEMMALATGNTYDPCSGTTSVFDVQIAEIKEKNRMVTSTTESAWSLGKWVVGGWTLSNIMDKAVGEAITYTASENGEINVGSQNTGSYNVASGDDANANTSIDGDTSYNNSDEKNIDNSEGREESEESEIIEEEEEEDEELGPTCSTDSDCSDGFHCSAGTSTCTPD